MKELPSTTIELIDLLDQVFPPKCPRPSESERDIWMYAGKRELIDLLIDRASSGKNSKPTKGSYYHVL